MNKHLQQHARTVGIQRNIQPQDIILALDTTYFHQFGVMAFRAVNLKKNLLWFEVIHETNELYRKGVQQLLDAGWNIQGIVADGKPGLQYLFPHIPFQMCQFHQCQIITRNISKKPKLDAGKELRQLMFLLTETDEASFTFWLEQWHERWKRFLGEYTIHFQTGKRIYTHRRLRTAYGSVKRNLPHLFTFERHFRQVDIPNTTNCIDGYFSHLKAKLNIHRGASKETQLKLIAELFFL